MVVPHVEREEVEFVCKALGCRPVAHPDDLTPDKLGSAGIVEEVWARGAWRLMAVFLFAMGKECRYRCCVMSVLVVNDVGMLDLNMTGRSSPSSSIWALPE